MNKYTVKVTDDTGQTGTYEVEAPRRGLSQNRATLAFMNDPAITFRSGCTLTHEWLKGGDLPW